MGKYFNTIKDVPKDAKKDVQYFMELSHTLLYMQKKAGTLFGIIFGGNE